MLIVNRRERNRPDDPPGHRPASALKIAVVAGAIATTGLLFPPSAHADDPCLGDPGCPRFGHVVCSQLDRGFTSGEVTQMTMEAYDLDKIMAASLVAGAIVKYCPWDG